MSSSMAATSSTARNSRPSTSFIPASEKSDYVWGLRSEVWRLMFEGWGLKEELRNRGKISEIGDVIQAKCLAFGDRVIKLNDYLLEQASQKYDGGRKRYDVRKGKSAFSHQTSNLSHPSYLSHQPSRVPVHLQSVAALANQLLRSGTSIGANNAEACNAISKADFKSKSFIALKEARESLYWIDLLHRNSYLDDKQYQSIYDDAEELVRILVTRCKKLNEVEV